MDRKGKKIKYRVGLTFAESDFLSTFPACQVGNIRIFQSFCPCQIQDGGTRRFTNTNQVKAYISAFKYPKNQGLTQNPSELPNILNTYFTFVERKFTLDVPSSNQQLRDYLGDNWGLHTRACKYNLSALETYLSVKG